MPPDVAVTISICQRFVLADGAGVVVPEPYFPLVPESWNGLLVVAEAQNLASETAYRSWLLAQAPEGRFRRLYRGNGVGIQPWDDGSLKLAIHAALDMRPEETAVSNAVPWSQRQSGGQNENPGEWLIEQ